MVRSFKSVGSKEDGFLEGSKKVKLTEKRTVIANLLIFSN